MGKVMTSKWLIAVSVIIAALSVLYVTGRKSVHTELVIAAPPEDVWSVLIAANEHREWNPVLVPIEGELLEGSQIKYEFRQEAGDAIIMTATVKRIIENSLLNQVGGTPGLLSFDHKYILEAVEGGTRVTIHEDYRGIAVPFWDPAPVELAYERLNLALKQRVIASKTTE